MTFWLRRWIEHSAFMQIDGVAVLVGQHPNFDKMRGRKLFAASFFDEDARRFAGDGGP